MGSNSHNLDLIICTAFDVCILQRAFCSSAYKNLAWCYIQFGLDAIVLNLEFSKLKAESNFPKRTVSTWNN
jgi:hypothetical protein